MTPDQYELLPETLRDGVRQYIKYGIKPGAFLTAVIEGDLYEARARADMWNATRLMQIAKWFADHAPAESFGSPELMAAWMKKRRGA